MVKKPEVSSGFAQRELDRAEAQFEKFDTEVKNLTLDRMNESSEVEKPSVEISKKDAYKDGVYIKPVRSISSKEPFNERFREAHTRAWEYVKCQAVNGEILGEKIELWNKKFPGDPATFWQIPVGVNIYIPRMIAKQISECKYHRLRMEQNTITENSGGMQYYGSLAVDSTVQRMDCVPVNKEFASNF